jgi:quinol monooxygenase YgiN
MNPGCTIVAYLHGKPEKREALLAILRGFVAPTRAEAGCVEYHLHVSDDDPNLFCFYENWRSRQALDQHLQMPYLKSFFDQRMELLEKDVELRFLTMDSDYET